MAPRKGLRVAGHPLHAALNHFPVALLMVSVLWDLLAVFGTGSEPWWRLSYWSIAVGLAAWVPAAISGLIDFSALPADSPAEPVANRHLWAMVGAGGAFSASFLLRLGAIEPQGLRLTGALSASGVGVALLLVGGWLGGELVYRHGVGRS